MSRKIIVSSFILMSFLVLAVPLISLAADTRIDYVKQQLVLSGIDKTSVNKLFADKRIKQYTFKIISYKQPNWNSVKNKLLAVILLRAGSTYIDINKDVFEKTERDFGVRKEVLAGIIAIETNFGKNTGSYITFNVLYSRVKQWSLAKWKRQANELIALSKYCLNSNKDCFSIKGSYAGAIGLVQFLPSSLLAYGVDGDNNGVIDLSKTVDAIPSAANFLVKHGWQKDELVALTHYYGSSNEYPRIVLTYASLLQIID